MSTTPTWRKSSRSAQAGNCVEVASAGGTDAALVRDSKLGDESPVLSLSEKAFGSFVSSVKAGRFDLG
ncbi:DUF397 domain-containing protein [Saccharopolyspora hirsuta]|uniref:DUF397 domain-containing protein n=1 Tax=Saccharopolyspora hirsuta TaxID=1837 RepID=A0A5M7BT08_SACHI|nr:DUF397 domain-containing protein [Saccharopolyspora hirsuta]KAA5831298.1 DUF397 domain-containing protein [Saccharopolyspora hirsuta]